jgi:hypothetical protein
VVDAGPLDVRPVPLGRGVVQGEGQPAGVGDQRLDRLQREPGGDAVGLLAGGRDGGIARAELVAQLGGSDPGGDGPPSAGQDRTEEQQGEPRGGPAIEYGGEA